MKSFHFHLSKAIAVLISFWSVSAAADILISGKMVCAVEKIITVEGSETNWKIYNGYGGGGSSEGDELLFRYGYTKYDGAFESLYFGFEGVIADEIDIYNEVRLDDKDFRLSVVPLRTLGAQQYDQKNKEITILRNFEDPSKVEKYRVSKNQIAYFWNGRDFFDNGFSISLRREKNEINRDGRWIGILYKIENIVSAIGYDEGMLISHQLFLRCSHKTKDVWDELIDAIAANNS